MGQKDFDKVQDRLGSQRYPGSGRVRRNRLAGHVKCASCGSPLLLMTTRRGSRYYRCRNSVVGILGAVSCSGGSMRAEFVEPAPVFDDEADGGSPGGSQ